MEPIYLSQSVKLTEGESKDFKGEFNGVAYSGAVIKQHGWMENLVIDLSTASVLKEKSPILRDHSPSQIAGQSTIKIKDDKVIVEGKLFKSSQYGKEIIDLASEGFEWELSVGVFDYEVEEVANEEVNGHLIEQGTVLRNAKIRETSFVALGADSNTQAQIFNVKDKGDIMFMTKEEWAKFACSCGGDKNTTPEQLKKKFEEYEEEIVEIKEEIAKKEVEVEAKTEEVEKLEDDVEKLEKEIEELEEKLEEKEEEDRVEEIQAAAKSKNISLSAKKIKEAAKSKESTSMLLSVIEDMTLEPKIGEQFAGRTNVSKKSSVSSEKDLIAKAQLMVKEGKAVDMIEALSLVQ